MGKWPEAYPDPDQKKKEEQNIDYSKPKKTPHSINGLLAAMLLVAVGIIIGMFLSFSSTNQTNPAPTNSPTPPPKPTETPITASNQTPTYPTPTPAAPFPGMVFSNPEGLWLANEKWLLEKISSHANARLSPDGRYLAYIKDGDLFLHNQFTDDIENLTIDVEKPVCCPQWWPAHPDKIVVRPWTLHEDEAITGIAVATIGGEYSLIDEIGSKVDSPSLSKGGNAIAYSQAGKPALYNWEEIKSIDLEEFGLPSFKVVAFPAWSPDGEKLAWVTTENPYDYYSQMHIIILNFATRTGKVVHTFKGELNNYEWQDIPESPAWSSDGEWLAFQAQNSIWVVSADGTQKHHLGNGSAPKWQPIAPNNPDNFQIALNRVEGPTLVFGPSGSSIGLISPDNGRLVEWRH